MKVLRARHAGFTLVELLIVIAIIVVLMAIAFPVFNRARERGRQSHCIANLHQIALAIRMYRMDEGAYPGPPDLVTGQGGVNALYPTYVTSRQALICPDDPIESAPTYLKTKELGDYNPSTGEVKDNGVAYEEIVRTSNSMYLWDGTDSSGDPADRRRGNAFASAYSSYNRYYNYYGYVSPPAGSAIDSGRELNLLDFNETLDANTGESIAFLYEWLRYDNRLQVNHYDVGLKDDVCLGRPNAQYVDCRLGLNLARQVYWPDYDCTSPTNNENSPNRLKDSLGRPLWDPDETAGWDQTTGQIIKGAYPDGIPTEVFPGLVNRNAPDSTIVTRCPNHRPWTMKTVKGTGRTGGKGGKAPSGGSAPERVYSQNLKTGQDVVLRLDGSAQLIPVLNANYDWALQSAQTH